MTAAGIRLEPSRLRRLHDSLLGLYGRQDWWPGDTDFEILAGTILVQRTRWENAALALAALGREGLLDPVRLSRCSLAELQLLVRPSGFYRQKARRLRALSRWLIEQGGLETLRRLDTVTLRRRLLALEGIGEETADCILLYVFERPVLIADAYARRLFRRLGWIGDAGYGAVAGAVAVPEDADPGFYNELHALIVTHGKSVCRETPSCGDCGLRRECPAADPVATPTGRPGSGRSRPARPDRAGKDRD